MTKDDLLQRAAAAAKILGEDLHPCGDCGAEIGALHEPGCDVARCVLCGNQALTDLCVWQLAGIDCRGANLGDRYDALERNRPPELEEPTEEMEAAYEAAVDEAGGHEIWTGLWPGSAECVEFGWYSRWGPPFIRCKLGDPGFGPDLNRLGAPECVWSRELRRWIKAVS